MTTRTFESNFPGHFDQCQSKIWIIVISLFVLVGILRLTKKNAASKSTESCFKVAIATLIILTKSVVFVATYDPAKLRSHSRSNHVPTATVWPNLLTTLA